MQKRNLIVVLLVAIPVVYLAWLGYLDLRAEEPRRAIVSMEMFISGDYLVPRIYGEIYHNKPPLFNWIMATFFALTGSFREWVVRLPSMLSFFLTAFLVYRVAKKYVQQEVALTAALMFLTAGDLIIYGTVNAGEIDMFFMLLTVAQVLALFWFFEQGKLLKMFLSSYLIMSAGVLTKGPPSILFQAMTLLALAIYSRRMRWLFSVKHLAGIMAFAFTSGLYFYLYAQEANVTDYLVKLFKEASQRTGLESVWIGIIKQFFLFPLDVIKWLLPWSLFLPFLFVRSVFSAIRANKLLWFLWLFILLNIPVYWISGAMKSRYVYMFFPFMLLLIAFFYQQNKDKKLRLNSIMQYFFLIFMLLLLAGLWVLPFTGQALFIPNIWPKLVLFFLAGLTIVWLYYRRTALRLYLVMLFMVFARLGINIFYFPVFQTEQQEMKCSGYARDMLNIAGEEDIYYTGEPYYFDIDASVGPVHFAEVKIKNPPWLAYQIVYYITREKKKIMYYHETARPGLLYLSPIETVDRSRADVLYAFKDHWNGRTFTLFRYLK